jgi:hypothetical protein
MNRCYGKLKIVSAAFALSMMATAASAATPTDAALSETVRQLQAEIDALRSENQTIRHENRAIDQKLTRIEAESGESWLNQRRTEQVKALIHEVLADADTRASLLQDGMTAGHNGKKFFLASADGSFLLELVGQIQVRYIYTNRDQSSDDGEFGMQIRRTKIEFSGHVASPKIKYAVQLAVSRDSNAVSADKITIGYGLTDDLFIWAGEDKAPFLREEMISSKRQLAVERSAVNEFFTLDKVQGVGLNWSSDMVKVYAMIHDGARSGDGVADDNFSDWGFPELDEDGSKGHHKDGTDFAVTGRVEVLLAGDWGQGKDFTSWSGEEMAILLGAAFHHQAGETGSSATNDNLTMWTFDASFEMDGLSAYVAYIGASTDFDDAGATADANPWGIVVQGGYNIPLNNGNSVEPFVRWEHIDFDNLAVTASDTTAFANEVDLVTVGANYYFKKHNAKLTTDVVWALDALPAKPLDASSGLGLLDDANGGADDQFALRVQFQLVW